MNYELYCALNIGFREIVTSSSVIDLYELRRFLPFIGYEVEEINFYDQITSYNIWLGTKILMSWDFKQGEKWTNETIYSKGFYTFRQFHQDIKYYSSFSESHAFRVGNTLLVNIDNDDKMCYPINEDFYNKGIWERVPYIYVAELNKSTLHIIYFYECIDAIALDKYLCESDVMSLRVAAHLGYDIKSQLGEDLLYISHYLWCEEYWPNKVIDFDYDDPHGIIPDYAIRS